eukprot:4384883-Ditylum_brightwellii.AAC.1
MGYLTRLHFKQHHKSRTPQLNDPRFAETFATGTLFSLELGLGGTENEGSDVFEDFIQDNGAPYTLRSGNAEMHTGNPAEKRIQDVKRMCTK